MEQYSRELRTLLMKPVSDKIYRVKQGFKAVGIKLIIGAAAAAAYS